MSHPTSLARNLQPIWSQEEIQEKLEGRTATSWFTISFSSVNGPSILGSPCGRQRFWEKRKKHNVLYFMLFSENIRLWCLCVMEFRCGHLSSYQLWLGLTWEYFLLCLHCSFLLSQNVNLEKYPVIFSSFSTMGHCPLRFCP